MYIIIMEDINTFLDNIFNKIDKNIKLDSEQKEAILCDNKRQIIIAGAGSGKTTVIAGKVKYLVEIKKVEPQKILIISFTNKAVNELKERINEKMQIECDIKTFHKFGLDIIKDDEEEINICTNNIEIIKEIIDEKPKCIKEIYCEYMKTKNIKKTLYLLNPFSQIKNNKKEEFINLISIILTKIKNKEILNIKYTKLGFEIKKLLQIYNEKLAKRKLYDFTDMIVVATEKILLEDYTFQYEYIIIDEYQDISFSRHELIKTIVNKFDTKLIVVGDDWQSIYGFSGTDVNLFTNFTKEYSDAKKIKITKTYRNSQELINIAGKFIMKNSKQIKKELISNKHIDEPIKIIVYKKGDAKTVFKQLINEISKKYPNQSLLVLGRYNFDIYKFIDNRKVRYKNNVICYEKLNGIKYMTVHASKGLGFDNVILLNCTKGTYGFPSYKEDNEILKCICPKLPEEIINEERRLFYVALTRTKNRIYLLVPSKNKSEFITEIKKYLSYVL